MCVRCGANPRDANVFLCRACRVDPATEDEVMTAMRRGRVREQRRILVDEYAWYGHWRTPREAINAVAPIDPAHPGADEAVAPRRGRQGDAGSRVLHLR